MIPEAEQDSEESAVPLVADPPTRDVGLYVFFALLAVGGITFLSMLSDAREDAENQAVIYDGSVISSPPPLAIPPDYLASAEPPLGSPSSPIRVRTLVPVRSQNPLTRTPQSSPPPQVLARTTAPASAAPASPIYGASLLPNRGVEITPAEGSSAERVLGAQDTERVLATQFRNPSVTVPQGTIIPAVLETALDSTRAGGVRALVQIDIHGFDGSRILIPRGSRLYGDYDTRVEQGERRALVTWTRLMRPDGVIIALESPASDPLGRAGIRGKVDSKFLSRFGNAILSSALDIGVGVAAAQATGGVVVAVPGAGVRSSNRQGEQRELRPSITVAHGTSVSVFVAKDLDFSSVGG